jgi:hypothetical protein
MLKVEDDQLSNDYAYLNVLFQVEKENLLLVSRHVILHHGCEVKTSISCHSHVDVDGHQYRKDNLL